MLKLSQNRLRVFFKKTELSTLFALNFEKPKLNLPGKLDNALSLAQEKNPQINLAEIEYNLAENELKRTRSNEFTPNLEAEIDAQFGHNIGGRSGVDEESSFTLKIEFPFSLGGSSFKVLKSAKEGIKSSKNREDDTKRIIEELVRNAWQNLQTTQENANILSEQASIAHEFLVKAKKERILGSRSLIDVLNGEVAWIQAKSQKELAERDYLKAQINLLHSIGSLKDSFSF